MPWHPLADDSNEDSRVIVALGKFDAMHKGHRSLALAAARMGDEPWLLSFSGMGQVSRTQGPSSQSQNSPAKEFRED